MEANATLDAPCSPAEIFSWLDDLAAYPTWMALVHSATPLEPDLAGPAWLVELRGRLGPLTRSKRLRMVRTTCVAPTCVRFERIELDGRDHAEWSLSCDVEGQPPDASGAAASGVHVAVTLRYGGSLWGEGLLERVLEEHIQRGSDRLISLVAPTQTSGRQPADPASTPGRSTR